MRIAIIDGHPDRSAARFCHALVKAYADGATEFHHEVRTLRIAELNVPVLMSRSEWENGALPPDVERAQQTLRWADHLVIVYPLWLGDMPALLKAFLEQVARPGFAFAAGQLTPTAGALKSKSARIIVTMGMPGFVYRWFFFKHSLTSLKRNILQFVGIRPVYETIIGSVEQTDHVKWLERIRRFGRNAR